MDRRELKVGIIGGLISSLVVLVFIQPILSLLWRAILTTGGYVHQGYIDRIYRRAATEGSNPYGQTTLYIVVMTAVFLALFWSLRSLESDPGSDFFARFARVASLVSWTMLLITALTVVGRLAILTGTAKTAETFTQRLTVLAPAISDTEYKTLRALWASMHGKADYEAIVSSMDRRATELGVTLPPAQKP